MLDPDAAARAAALPLPARRSSAGGSTRIGMPSLSSSVPGSGAALQSRAASGCTSSSSAHQTTAVRSRSTHTGDNQSAPFAASAMQAHSSRSAAQHTSTHQGGAAGVSCCHVSACSTRLSLVPSQSHHSRARLPASNAQSVRSSAAHDAARSEQHSPQSRMSLPQCLSSSSSEPERLQPAAPRAPPRNFAAEADSRRGSFARSWRSDGSASAAQAPLVDQAAGTCEYGEDAISMSGSLQPVGEEAMSPFEAGPQPGSPQGTMEDVLAAQRKKSQATSAALCGSVATKGQPDSSNVHLCERGFASSQAAPALAAMQQSAVPPMARRRSVQFSTRLASSAGHAAAFCESGPSSGGVPRGPAAQLEAAQEECSHSGSVHLSDTATSPRASARSAPAQSPQSSSARHFAASAKPPVANPESCSRSSAANRSSDLLVSQAPLRSAATSTSSGRSSARDSVNGAEKLLCRDQGTSQPTAGVLRLTANCHSGGQQHCISCPLNANWHCLPATICIEASPCHAKHTALMPAMACDLIPSSIVCSMLQM